MRHSRAAAKPPVSPTTRADESAADESMRILSSSHLASGKFPELSEFEFGLIVAGNAFSRWAIRCMAAAGAPDLTLTDVLVLHHVHHRDRSKKLADICFTLNYEDTHVVSYALKKMATAGWVSSERVGKEVHYATTPAGRALLERYRKVRDRCLLPSVHGETADSEGMLRLARLLRTLSGLYDQAARAAASL
jgi:predicted MarR family transcription regulator